MSLFSEIFSKTFNKRKAPKTENVELYRNDIPSKKNPADIHEINFEHEITKDNLYNDSLYVYIGAQRYLAALPLVTDPDGDKCVLYPCLSSTGSYRMNAVGIDFIIKNMKLACKCFANFITEGTDITYEYLCNSCVYAIEQHISEHNRIIDSDLMAITYAYLSVYEALHNHSHIDDYNLNINRFQKDILDQVKFYHSTKLFITVFNGPFPALKPYNISQDD